MQIHDYSTLVVGQVVAIARTGGWRTHSEGVYTVAKVDKMKVVVKRDSDGYERSFSIKTRNELGRGHGSMYRWAYIETVESMQQREAHYKLENDRKQNWADAEQAARNKDLDTLKQLVLKIEQQANDPVQL